MPNDGTEQRKLTPGAQLGPYEMRAPLGAGGMGEVWRAQDTRLGREVAIKVLPKEFATDADRLRRFEQEAKTLAALNHPNILTIHDVGLHERAPYLVSELLEGQTLREEMNGSALLLRKATDFGLQVAHGLAAAHGRGLIHRDLKPENIFITKDGRVKILDFGLAKLKDPSPHPMGRGQGEGTNEQATIRIDANTIVNTTEPGLVLGTPGYLAPEQVRGEEADHRSDLFAFGAVLYEMLANQRAFKRDTPIETMNAILTTEPPELVDLPNLSPVLDRVVRRCLEKQPDNRFQSAKDLAFAIENAGAAATSSLRNVAGNAPKSPFSFQRMLPWVVAVLCLAGFLFVVLQRHNSGPLADKAASIPVRKFELTLPPAAGKAPGGERLHPCISPDGRKLAYANVDGLWLRWLDRATPPVRLRAGENIASPFWSPQSTDVGYFEGRKLYRISINGGGPILIGTAPEAASNGAEGGAWLAGDRIVFATGFSALYEAPAQGGKVVPALALAEGESDFHEASALPAARGVLFVVHRTVAPDTIAVWRTGAQRKVLLQLPGSRLRKPVFSPTGHVLFHRVDESRGLWAFAFSLVKLERSGEPFRVSDAGSLPSVSDDGTLVFCLREFFDDLAPRQLTWVDRSGRLLGTLGPPLPGLADQHISPDGRRVVGSSGESLSGTDLWMFDVAGGGAIPLSRNQEDCAPQWWDGGRTVVFTRRGASGSQVLAKTADGSGQEKLLFDGLEGHLSSSGRYLMGSQKAASGHFTLGYVPTAGTDKKLVAFPDAYQHISHCKLSPDDRLLAYGSYETGQSEVYVVEFPGFTNKIVVSRGGGRHQEWHPKGTELFFLSNDGRTLMSAPQKPAGAMQLKDPSKVFDLPKSIHGGFSWWPSLYDVAQDGERFLMLQKVEDKSAGDQAVKPNVLVVQNWFEEFREKR